MIDKLIFGLVVGFVLGCIFMVILAQYLNGKNR